MSKRLVEVLVFDGCPNLEVTLQRARDAVIGAAPSAEVRLVKVVSDEEAQRLRFLGSPTVRVDGADIDPTATERDDFGLQCRVYSVAGRLVGAPPAEWIASALRGDAPRDAGPLVPTGSAITDPCC